MTFRSLRAANRGLYLGMTLLVAGVCLYTLLGKAAPVPLWQQAAAAAAALVTLLWGGSYALLRYQVDAEGISRHRLPLPLSLSGLHNRILWAELDRVEHEEEQSPGTTRLTLRFIAKDGRSLTLSSDLLPLDALEELTTELRHHGLLPEGEKTSQ